MLILGKGPTQGLNNTTLTVESLYPINFTRKKIIKFYYLYILTIRNL